MIIISGVLGVLLIIFLILRVAQMTGGVKTTIATVHGTFDEYGNFRAGPPPPVPLPLSETEYNRQAAAMPMEWVTYMGTTPPLKLKLRGTTEDMFRQTTRKYINMIGQENFERLPSNDRDAVLHSIMSEAYALDWEGARYPNGNPMPFSSSALSLMLNNDPHLVAFLSGEIERISPEWAAR